MNNKELILEVEALLSKSEELITQGKTTEASAKIAEAKDKDRPCWIRPYYGIGE